MEIHTGDILPSRRKLIMLETKFKIGNPVAFDDVVLETEEESNLDPNDDHQGEIDWPRADDPTVELENDIIIILPRIITDEGCDEIISIHQNAPYDDVTIENEHDITPSEKVQNFNLSYKYAASHNKDHMTIAHNSPEYKKILNIMGSQIPEHPDFDRITYMQIVHYKKDAFFPYHRDEAESTDFATCIMQLNDDFHGGQLNVQGCHVPKRRGTIAFFNNSTRTWHGVEPIYDGERYVLLIWFGRSE